MISDKQIQSEANIRTFNTMATQPHIDEQGRHYARKAFIEGAKYCRYEIKTIIEEKIKQLESIDIITPIASAQKEAKIKALKELLKWK